MYKFDMYTYIYIVPIVTLFLKIKRGFKKIIKSLEGSLKSFMMLLIKR